MPEVNESEVPTTSQIQMKRNKRTKTVFFKDADNLIAEAKCLGTNCQAPNRNASVVNMKAKRNVALATLERLHLGKSQPQIKIRRIGTSGQKHRQNALLIANAVAKK